MEEKHIFENQTKYFSVEECHGYLPVPQPPEGQVVVGVNRIGSPLRGDYAYEWVFENAKA